MKLSYRQLPGRDLSSSVCVWWSRKYCWHVCWKHFSKLQIQMRWPKATSLKLHAVWRSCATTGKTPSVLINIYYQNYQSGIFKMSRAATHTRMWNENVWTLRVFERAEPQDRGAKHTDTTANGRTKGYSDWPNQSSDFSPIDHAFHLLKTRMKALGARKERRCWLYRPGRTAAHKTAVWCL